MEIFAHIVGVLAVIALMLGLVVWFLNFIKVIPFITGCIGGIFEETTKKKGIF